MKERIRAKDEDELYQEWKPRFKCWAHTVEVWSIAKWHNKKAYWDDVETYNKCGYCGGCMSWSDFHVDFLDDIGELIEASAFMD